MPAMALLHRIQQRVLVQQVADRVAGHAKLGEHRQCHGLVVAAPGHAQDRLGVGRRVGQGHARRARGNAGKAVPVEREEGSGRCHAGSYLAAPAHPAAVSKMAIFPPQSIPGHPDRSRDAGNDHARRQSAARTLDHAVRGAPLRSDRCGAFPPRLRCRHGIPPGRGRQHRGRSGTPELRQHDRSAATQRPAVWTGSATSSPTWSSVLAARRWRRWTGRCRPSWPSTARRWRWTRRCSPAWPALHTGRDALNLAEDQRRLLERTYLGFVRSGAALDPAAKARMSEISQRLAVLHTAFGQNVLHDEKAWHLPRRRLTWTACRISCAPVRRRRRRSGGCRAMP